MRSPAIMKRLLVVFSFIIFSSGTQVRLRGVGSSSQQGRVEVYHNGEWGTICDDDWDDLDASVICRMLNFRKGGKAYGKARFGAGRGPILLDNVDCDSAYTSDISQCRHGGWGNHDCEHSEDAGVSCKLYACESGTFGTSCIQRCHCKIPGCHNITGVCHNVGCQDGWKGSSCNRECSSGSFGPDCLRGCHCEHSGCHNVTGVCHSAGCQDGWEGPSCDKECERGTFGTDCLQRCHCEVSGCHHVTGVCNVAGCQDGWEGPSCDKGTRVRLRGVGSSLHQGRVEVYHDGEWGTICDDDWGDDDASVICRMLNFSKGGKSYYRAHFGKGSGPIFLDDVECVSGYKGDISDCPHNGWRSHNCNHGEDAGVACQIFDCEIGSFGTGCLKRCHCKIPDCHNETGVCSNSGCQNGWKGLSCDQECEDEEFGPDCLQRCHCKISGCSDITGVCQNAGCQDGWEGSSCDKECENGIFGRCCSQECHCKIPGCHHVSGVCYNEGCQNGWEGLSCDKECEGEEFGPDCLRRCHCKTPGCSNITGVCHNAGCQDGWEGTSCDKECENGTFGTDCSQRCHCKVPGCHHLSGVCNNTGCQDGWEGSSCDKVTVADYTAYIIGITLGTLLAASIATNIALFVITKRRAGHTVNGNATDHDALPVPVRSDHLYESLALETMPSGNDVYETVGY